MSMPFYVAPEQVMKDRADYARKGIARGRSLVALEYANGIVIVAENPSRTLFKISEIYDNIGFAGVGKYNEFQMLKIAGVRLADVKGYQYSREDVTANALANAYAQTLGQVFTHEMKPYEVEILVAQVGTGEGTGEGAGNELFHILYDGTVMDEERYTVLGGQAETIAAALEEQYAPDLELGAAIRLGARVLSPSEDQPVAADQLEVAVLERSERRRAVPPHQRRRAQFAPRGLSQGGLRETRPYSQRIVPRRHAHDVHSRRGRSRGEGPAENLGHLVVSGAEEDRAGPDDRCQQAHSRTSTPLTRRP